MKIRMKWPPWGKEKQMPIDDVGPLMTAREYFEEQRDQILGILNKDRSRRIATYNLWFDGATRSWKTDGYKKQNPPSVPLVGAVVEVDEVNMRLHFPEEPSTEPLCDERPLPWDVEPEPRPTQQVGEWNADGWYLPAFRSNPDVGDIVQYEGQTLKFLHPTPWCYGWFTEAGLAANFHGEKW